jgi:tRNA1(Val) A37 N6-methylase TrmN6
VLLVSNPPFFRIGSGRVSASRQLCLAKHEVACTLQELLDAIARALPGGEGEAALIFTADREAELAAGLAARGLTTLARRWVIPLPGRPATRCLVLAASSRSEAVGAQACAEEPPLVVELEPGRFSPELEGILGEKPAEQEDTRCQTS